MAGSGVGVRFGRSRNGKLFDFEKARAHGLYTGRAAKISVISHVHRQGFEEMCILATTMAFVPFSVLDYSFLFSSMMETFGCGHFTRWYDSFVCARREDRPYANTGQLDSILPFL